MRARKPAAPVIHRIIPPETLMITGLSHDGRGLAHYQGKAFFVEGALEGEQVQIKIQEEHRRFVNAKTTAVLQVSPERCKPDCPSFSHCGGCSMQYWSHTGQLKGKQRIVLEQLERFGDVIPELVVAPLTSTPYGYRHRCRLAIRWGKGGLRLGFRQKGSNAVCPVDSCSVLVPSLQNLPKWLQQILPELKGKTAVSHAELIQAENITAVILRHTRMLSAEDKGLLVDRARDKQCQLWLQDNSGQLVQLYSPDSLPLSYSLPDFQLELLFLPGDFTQVNASMNRLMVAQAVKWLQPDSHDNILDLFCGLGNFSLPLSRYTRQVTGVEVSGGAIERAKNNAVHNNINNCHFFQGDLTGHLSNQWSRDQYDALVLDPPRTGARELLKKLEVALPERILYISCNPATLARDAGLLKEQGFSLKQLGIMDMFPQTEHIESMALFQR
ncbi:23S rRNA (uracil(1939)-C(5))-methyltransferase RlmD [invertebrate metagenome]|uniref:23S rRNA (Uracil(1939)-C(5))-methyltransferase RlmD n=1 Tax=invertebrate metagenome TaxID=1711999 RepID=A0A2H9T8H0_9ZZZZ